MNGKMKARTRAAAYFFLSALLSGAAAQAQRIEPMPNVLTLNRLLDIVATRHPTILAAQARARAARGARQTAGQFGNPVAAYQVENAAFPGSNPPLGIDKETMAALTFPLEPLYQRGSRRKQADALSSAALAESEATVQSVSLEAVRSFYRVAQLQVRAEASRDVASWLDSVVAYNRSRVREGVVAEADLLRAQVERDRMLSEAIIQEADLARASAELAAFLGDPARAAGAMRIAWPSRVLPLALVGRSVTERPDVRAANERLHAADAGVGLERSMFLRQLGATIGTKWITGTTSMIAGFSLPLPLFDQNRGEVARAIAERDAASFELNASNRLAASQVTGAAEAARILTARATAMASSADTGFLARAEQVRGITFGAYREGAVPLIQVLDAARAWNEARVTFHDLLFAQHQSILELVVASGIDVRSVAKDLDTPTVK